MDQSGSEINEINALVNHSKKLLTGMRSRASDVVSERKIHLEQFGAEAIELIEQVAGQIAGELANQLHAERNDLESQQQDWQSCKQEWEKVRDEVEAELAAREKQLLEQSQLANESPELNARLEEIEQEAETLRRELVTKTDANNTIRDHCLTVENERDELQQKFELALADLQQHREHLANLEEELANRPEMDNSESVELSQLRSERDELVARLDELSLQAAHASEPADVADLRERFEMAVDEVRELKNTNQELEQKLANQPAASSIQNEGDDWETQKRRMLAMLDDEGETTDQERSQERASIAGTIQITDGVVQQKDQKIAELAERVEQLESQESSTSNPSATDEAAAAILDVNEVISAERERLAKLEADWEEKLRAAELELSVERAKITRAQAEIAKQQQAIEAFQDIDAAHKAAEKDEGKRKWFKKLGLGDDIKE